MTAPSRRLSYAAARARAADNNWREKVLAYVTRGRDELLVFAHTIQYPDAGIQVPAGGVESGEEPSDAVIRELFEESGLRLDDPIYLASFEWLDEAPSRIRHFYWLRAPIGTPDRWDHRVSAGEQDVGMIFRYAFAPRSAPGIIEGFGFDSALDDLDRLVRG